MSTESTISNRQSTSSIMRRPLGIGFAIALLSVSLSSCNHFGFDKALSDATDNAIQVIRAPFYGFPDNSVHDDIAVMLYSESDYRNYGWPLPYSAIQEMVEEVDSGGAKSLFIDLVLTLPRYSGDKAGSNETSCLGDACGGLSERYVDQEFCSMAHSFLHTSGRVPDEWLLHVLYNEELGASVVEEAGILTPKPGCLDRALSVDTELQAYLEGTTTYPTYRNFANYTTLRALSADPENMPVLIGAELDYLEDPSYENTRRWAKYAVLDRVALLVPIAVGTDSNDLAYRMRVTRYDFASPGLLLAKSIGCERSVHPEFCTEAPGTIDMDILVKAFANETPDSSDLNVVQQVPEEASLPIELGTFNDVPEFVHLLWGGISQESQQAVSGENMKCVTRWGRAKFILGSVFFGSARGTTVGQKFIRSPCPYHFTFPYGLIADSGKTATNLAQMNQVKAGVSNKVIVFGADFNILDDSIQAPLRGTIAAVNTHAFAYDNLLTLRHPVKDTREIRYIEYINPLIEFLIAWLSIAFLLHIRDRANTAPDSLARLVLARSPKRAKILGILMILIGAIGFYGVVSAIVNSPTNYYRMADFFAAMLLMFVFAIGLSGTYISIRAARTGRYKRRGVRPARVLEILAPQAAIAIFLVMFGLLIAALISVITHWPAANIFGAYIFVFGTQLMVFREEFYEAAKCLVTEEIADAITN